MRIESNGDLRIENVIESRLWRIVTPLFFSTVYQFINYSFGLLCLSSGLQLLLSGSLPLLKCLRQVPATRLACHSSTTGPVRSIELDSAAVTVSQSRLFIGATTAHSLLHQLLHWLFFLNNHRENTSTLD